MQNHIFHCIPLKDFRDPPTVRTCNTPLPVEELSKFLGLPLVGFAYLLQEAHHCAEDRVHGGPQSHLRGRTYEVGRRQRNSADVLWGHCPFQARSPMYCVRYSIRYQSMTTGQHLQRWTKTGTWSVLHQPNPQYVRGDQESSFGRMPVEAVHALPSENSRLHRKPGASCPTWLWSNLNRPVSSQAKNKRRHDQSSGPPHQSQPRGSHDICRDVELLCPLGTPSFPPGTHEYDPKRLFLIEGVSKDMITREEHQAKFSEYRDAQGPHDTVCTDGSKNNVWGQQWSSTVIFRMVRRLANSCPKDSRITAPSLMLRLQPSHWHLTNISTWILYSTML